jgi:ubiquinone/menaquinone biosynthesis C-methylase UbiE
MQPGPLLLCLVVFVAGLAALLYWQLVVAEGAHLGPRVVTALYDLVAHRYERIKRFDPKTESESLGWPLAMALTEVDQARVLDVACGTGRAARALLREAVLFDGSVVNLDLASRMLRYGRPECAAWAERTSWVQAPAEALPFDDGCFDAVICLEALEFLPDARAALAECLRVLRPAGLLLVTNRIGRDARLIPGKTYSPAAFQALLAQYPLAEVRCERWQVEYDLAWGRKLSSDGPGAAGPGRVHDANTL